MKVCRVLVRSVDGGGGGGVEEQGIQVQDNQPGGQGAALTDTRELGVTKKARALTGGASRMSR